jgi:hypothetical protein
MRPVKFAFFIAGLLAPLPALAQLDQPDDGTQSSGPGAYSDVPVGPFNMLPPPVNGPRLGEGDVDWTMNYSGFLRGGYHASFGARTDSNGNTFDAYHIPGTLPDNIWNTWLLTNAQPTSWGSFSLTLGTNTISTGMYFGAWAHAPQPASPSMTQWAEGTMAFGPWVTLRSNSLFGSKFRGEISLGNAGRSYGQAGKYDLGPYGTTAVGGVWAYGELVALEKDFGDYTLRLEDSLGANPGDNNLVATTVVHHAHLIAKYKETVRAGLHYFAISAKDERYTTRGEPDGGITALGADLRLNNTLIGDFFLGGGFVKLDHSRHVGPAFVVSNVAGGQAFMDNFLGADVSLPNYGTGSLANLMIQYDFSLAALKQYPTPFWGDAADLRISVFGLGTKVRSTDPDWDNVLKVKVGADMLYAFLPWLGFAVRYDRVMPNVDSPEQTFQVISPRVVLRTSFGSHEQIMLQYSHYFYGTDADGRVTGPRLPSAFPMAPSAVGRPNQPYDADVVGIAAQMWY